MPRIFSFLLFVLAFMLSAPFPALAQMNGSGYSRYGIGDLLYYPNSRAAAMGGTDIATAPSTVIDAINPANWTGISMTRFSASGIYRHVGTDDGTSSASYGTTLFNGFALAIPVSKPHGIVAAMTLQPYSTVGYTILSSESQGGLSYDMNYHGEGGLSRAQIGLSARFAGSVNLGLTYNYYFGSIRHNIMQTTTIGGYQNSSSTREVQLKGSGVTLGFVFTGLGTMLKVPEKSAVHVGAFLSTTSYLSADEERRTGSATSTVSAFDTVVYSTYKLKLPLRFGIGIGYITERFTAGSDITMQNWDQTKYPGVLSATVRNSYRWSLGGELMPKREQGAPFMQKWAYRAGVYYNATYFMIGTQPVNELGFSGGFSIPILGETRLDLTGEYGMRGSTDSGMQKDNLFRLSFSIIGGEPWFVRPAEE